VNLLVDTSVWSLALRRDAPPDLPEVFALRSALEASQVVVTTGLILQEVLQGFSGPKARDQILERFRNLPLLTPDRADHVEAADLRNDCRRRGVQVGTIDALLTRLCQRYELMLLTTDRDFQRIAAVTELSVWPRGPRLA
jgi:predicted nucleic acid-binding protein